MAKQITNVIVGDGYTDAATIGPEYSSQGGYFTVANAGVICELAISSPPAGIMDEQWGSEIPVPVGNGIIYADTVGIRFRNLVAGTPATVSGVIFSKAEAAITIIAGGGFPPFSGGGAPQLTAVVQTISGGALTPGIVGDVILYFACKILNWTLLADTAGSLVVDLWKVPYAAYPAGAGNSITGGAPPTITGANKAQGNPTGWVTSVAAGDTIRFNIVSAATITRCTLALELQPA